MSDIAKASAERIHRELIERGADPVDDSDERYIEGMIDEAIAAAREADTQEIAELREAIEMYEGMKEGVTIRFFDLERKLEACRRYFEHAERISVSANHAASDSALMNVRMSLKQEAKEACGI